MFVSNAYLSFTIGKTDYVLVPNHQYELPEDNDHVKSLAAQGMITRVKSAAAPAPAEPAAPAAPAATTRAPRAPKAPAAPKEPKAAKAPKATKTANPQNPK